MKIVFLALLISTYLTKFLFSATEATKPVQYDFSFKGILGTIDKKSAQRGLQVFTEVCASCHGLKHLAYRNLEDLGYNKSQINNIAKQYLVDDLPDENGEIKKRNAIYSDNFVDPYPNQETAKSFNNGAYPPDLTLMVKARKDGANYLRSLLLGYEDTPEGLDVGEGYYNKYMPGNIIAMPQPLYGDDVTYADGAETSVEAMSADLTQFLMWAAEPKLEARKRIGVAVVFFLSIFVVLSILAKRRGGANVH